MLKRLIKLQQPIRIYFGRSPSFNNAGMVAHTADTEEQLAAQVDDAYDDDDDHDDGDGNRAADTHNSTTVTSNGRRRRKASPPEALSDNEWTILRGLRKELKTFALATQELSAEYSPTAALIWPTFAKLSGHHHSVTILSTERTLPFAAIPQPQQGQDLQHVCYICMLTTIQLTNNGYVGTHSLSECYRVRLFGAGDPFHLKHDPYLAQPPSFTQHSRPSTSLQSLQFVKPVSRKLCALCRAIFV